jgi:hypothetical protein
MMMAVDTREMLFPPKEPAMFIATTLPTDCGMCSAICSVLYEDFFSRILS